MPPRAFQPLASTKQAKAIGDQELWLVYHQPSAWVLLTSLAIDIDVHAVSE